LKTCGASQEITTLLGRADKDEVVAKKVTVDRDHRFGENYLGMSFELPTPTKRIRLWFGL
jgi:hypothetical protein